MRIPSLQSETIACLMSVVSLFHAFSFAVIGAVKDDYFPWPFRKISGQ